MFKRFCDDHNGAIKFQVLHEIIIGSSALLIS